MSWQSIVFGIGGWWFALSLLPMVTNKNTRVPRSSSGATAAFLWLFTITHISLGFWFAVVGEAVSASMWTAVFLLRPAPNAGMPRWLKRFRLDRR